MNVELRKIKRNELKTAWLMQKKAFWIYFKNILTGIVLFCVHIKNSAIYLSVLICTG